MLPVFVIFRETQPLESLDFSIIKPIKKLFKTVNIVESGAANNEIPPPIFDEKGVRLEFAQFGHFDSFEVIRSLTSMIGIADHELPTPIATGLKTMYYVDSNVIEGLTYYYKVRVKRGTESYLSDELSIFTSKTNNMQGGIEEIITINGLNYKVHTFTSSGILEVISISQPISILVVGGGGSGCVYGGGGGGGGGVVFVDEYMLLETGGYTIDVGSGAPEHPYASTGGTGGTSSIQSPSSIILSYATGGTGGNSGGGGRAGGSSGNGYFNGMRIQTSITGAGENTNGDLNGGAGAGAQANYNGGGAGLLVTGFDSINGYYYGAGGGSGQRSAGGSGWKGGISGGGNGLYGENQGSSTAGTPNSGGGGGGSWGNYNGQNGGGSGVIKIKYRI
jgi:hypothetical protein